MSTVPVNKRKRDWFHVIRTLMRYGVSMHDIGRACDRDHTTVRFWQDGGEPRESDARIVLALMAKHAPEEYLLHQREFDIRIEVEHITSSGEQRRLVFAGQG